MCRQHQRLGQNLGLSEGLAAVGYAWWVSFCGFELLTSHHTTNETNGHDSGVFSLLFFQPDTFDVLLPSSLNEQARFDWLAPGSRYIPGTQDTSNSSDDLTKETSTAIRRINTQNSTDRTRHKISPGLDTPPCAVAPLEPLMGEWANFMHTVWLLYPLQDGATRVVVKHGDPFISCHASKVLRIRSVLVDPIHL
jgi:hypothetical protein